MTKNTKKQLLTLILLLSIFINNNSTCTASTTALVDNHLDDLKNLFNATSNTLNDKCFTQLNSVLQTGLTPDQYAKILTLKGSSYMRTWHLATSPYFAAENPSSFKKLDYINNGHGIYNYIASTLLSDNEGMIIWNATGTDDRCLAFLNPEAQDAVGLFTRNLFDNYLIPYLKDPGDTNWNNLQNFLKNTSGNLQIEQNNIEALNFLMSGGITPPASLTASDCDPTDCLCKAATKDVSIFKPGTWIRGIIAAIALGSRKILSWVANAFMYAFIGLPQKLGGYVHFKPIYDYDPVTKTKTGIWSIMLAYANIGIVLGMIFMAIATIFRIEKYSWKKMLPKLLLVAFLVNFSLIILGIFVDISNFLSMSFLSSTSSTQLGDILEGVVTQTSCSIYFQNADGFIATMTAITLAIILSSIFLFQFAGLLMYVLTRIATIWICAATSPLAFLGMAIDAEPIKKVVDMWRDRFTQAIVSLPILAFSLYLSLMFISEVGHQISASGQTGNTLGFVMLITYSGIIIVLAQVLRFVAKSIGIEQIEQGYAFARKAVTGAVMAGGAMVGGFALGKAVNSGWYNNLAEGLSAKEGGLGEKPILGAITRPISTQLYKLKGRVSAARTKADEEKLKPISGEKNALTNEFIHAVKFGQTEKALTILQMKADADFELTEGEQKFVITIPDRFKGLASLREHIYKTNPALRDKSIDEIVARYKAAPTDANMREILKALKLREKLDPVKYKDDVNRFFLDPNFGVIKTAKSVEDIVKFIRSIPFSDRKIVLGDIATALGKKNFKEVVQENKKLHDLIDDVLLHEEKYKKSPGTLAGAYTIRDYWG